MVMKIMKTTRMIAIVIAAMALGASSTEAFQIVVPSCYLLGRAEQRFIEYRDYPVPEQKILDYTDHKLLKEHPNALGIIG
jgi:hypothetical protein